MNKKIFIASLLLPIVANAGKPVDSAPSDTVVMKYAGQTEGKVLPSESLVEKNALCRAEYPDSNPPARMATSEEMINSINDGTYQTIDNIALLKSTKGINGATIDYSGSPDDDCMTTSSANHISFIGVNNNGLFNKFHTTACTVPVPYSVACSTAQ